ncbi:hypothetical protein IHE31_01935 (plasmid) [Mycetohabitans rhizoxinica]|uniref:Uncharacterized protein n=2 Tax=Mycetohabitans rhizoxinica TaxID=412963 RepID=A0ABZ2PSU0_9BURK
MIAGSARHRRRLAEWGACHEITGAGVKDDSPAFTDAASNSMEHGALNAQLTAYREG